MKRIAVGLPLVVIVSLLALLLVSTGPSALAQGSHRVGLVVKFDNGSVYTECIEFSQPGLTGCEVLELSALSVAYGGYGAYGEAVCSINDVGCPASNCFCQCTGADCEYWAYFHLAGGKWEYSTAGCSSHSVHHGDVEGWAWGAGTIGATSEVEPPLKTFEELCVPPTPTPKPSPPIVDFTADPERILGGQCSTLSWSVDNGEVVVLDGEGVKPYDARYLCPPESHTYELQVLNAAGEYSYEVTIEVTQPTATPIPSVTPTPVPSATPEATTASSPPPTSTAVPDQPTPSPSPSQPPSPTSTEKTESAAVAVAHTATPTLAPEDSGEVAEPGDVAETEVTSPKTTAPQETVGLDRILLLLGVGAGTLGFGTMFFVAMLMLLVMIYMRARAQF